MGNPLLAELTCVNRAGFATLHLLLGRVAAGVREGRRTRKGGGVREGRRTKRRS